MRRCLQAFLVGVLTLSLSMDSARACWYLRQAQRQRGCPPAAVAVGWDACGRPQACSAVVIVSDVPCGSVVQGEAAWSGCEPIACGTPVECCGQATAAVTAVAPAAPAGERVAVPGSDSVLANPPAAAPTVVDVAPQAPPTIVPVEPPPVLSPAADVMPASNNAPVPAPVAVTPPVPPAAEWKDDGHAWCLT
ncbi:MAG: hypothetical protein EBR23_03790, partial [Planctomycetia bacterium]|nr:hypothetical protein [Planctomycetia bacterium]